MFVSNSWITDLIIFSLTIFIITTGYFKWSFQYWKRRNLSYLEPQIPFGNCRRSICGEENWAITMKRIYNRMKQNGWKHGGFYMATSPNYMPVSLDHVRNIMAKDFHYFTDRAMYSDEEANPLDGNLFSTRFSRWRHLRPKLTPSFTFAKLKTNFPTLLNCRENLLEKMDELSRQNASIDIKEVVIDFALDVLKSYALGVNLQSDEENSLFKEHIERISRTTLPLRLKMVLAGNFPKLASFLNMSGIPKYLTDFFVTTVTDIIVHREKNKYRRNDFMQTLIDMKNNDNDFTIGDIAAQTFAIVTGGFETAATSMTYALYELSKHPDVQERARDEVLTVLEKYDGEITFEAIQDMKYLSQILDETLRMYPSIPMINRRCVKDYKIENEEIIIERGTNVVIPMLAIHYDEEYYVNPEEFDPERFSEENKTSRHKYAYIPFGAGPRMCIGTQFSSMQVKLGLSCLIRAYKFCVDSKTAEPITFQPNAFLLTAVGGVWLKAEKLEG